MAKEDIKDVLLSTSKLASYSMILQLSIRVLTFLLNAVTLRYISTETLGVVNVRLLLLYSTVLFLSREAFRRACLGHSPKKTENKQYAAEWQRTMNLLWCIVPVGVVFTTTLMHIWMQHLQQPSPDVIPHYNVAVLVFGFSVMIELVAEPLFIMAQSLLFIKLKIVSEGIPMILKCVSCVFLLVNFPHWGIMSFCIAQMIFSLSYVFIIYTYFTWYVKSGRYLEYEAFPFNRPMQFLPNFAAPVTAINYSTASLVWSFFKQSALKQVLTEGEKYVMTFFNILSFEDQGIYDIINNLGSLAARFIFLPIEESFYVFFSKMLDRGVPVEKQDRAKIKLTKHVLYCLLRLVFLIGLLILTFGYSFSYMFLRLYGGSMLSEGSGPTLLRVYSFYVLLLAINGTTECFFFSAMSQDEVDRYNKKMLLFSLVFLASSYYLTVMFGSIGFILANCLNMVVRIWHSLRYINRYFGSEKDSPVHGLVPHWMVLQCYGAAFAICGFSEAILRETTFLVFVTSHTIVGIVCLSGILAVLWITEKDVVQFVKQQYFSEKENSLTNKSH